MLPRPRALPAAGAALLLLTLLAVPAKPLDGKIMRQAVQVALEPVDRAHTHAERGAQRAIAGGERAPRLPVPTPQEIDALLQLVRILASLVGAGASQVVDESAPLAALPPPHRSMPPPVRARRARFAATLPA